ncbi:restriction endonuclease subunit S [Veillonella agrestimuris]|uniref:restriction endonuclease subunit S n=1 Tax=Veillonella agrestimuris TaxID=2941340 RepID=UPI002041C7C8|nr:restriction endonuclease subunit S [Veillonella agrestimuris]
MYYIKELFHSNTGISQFRLEESTADNATLHTFYGQIELEEDLTGVADSNAERKQIKLVKSNSKLEAGDLIFSTISGKATVVNPSHEGYIFTQNYVRMVPLKRKEVDNRYIAFLINENTDIKKQFQQNLQGTKVIRYSLSMLKEIQLPKLPNIEIQRLIGDIYYKQQKLKALKYQVADYEYMRDITLLKGGY